MSNNFKKFNLNEVGRDFVIGDIHGAYDLVLKGMKEVGFNKKTDRLFSVGDLIDRGPDSARALKFLAQPYVFAVPGNHDRDFSSLSIDEIRTLGGINWNGMKWTNGVDDTTLIALKQAFSALPIAIEIQTDRGSVGLVHADVPLGMSWQEFTLALENDNHAVIDRAVMDRDRIQSHDQSGVRGIDRVFVGHTIQWKGPKRFGNIYAIDTGAVFREIKGDCGSLTIANIVCATGLLIQKNNESEVDSLCVIDKPAPGKFGKYSL